MLAIRHLWSLQRSAMLWAVMGVMSVLIVSGLFTYRYVSAQPVKRPLENIVRGYLAIVPGARTTGAAASNIEATAMVANAKQKAIFIPGVYLYLKDPQTGKTSDKGRTDLSGRFTLYAPQAGQYQLCWKSDVYGAGCLQKLIAAGREPQFLSTVKIGLPPRDNFVAIFGKVDAQDGSSPRTFEPMLNINSFARVGLEDEKGKALAEVYVNNFGEYLVPYVPAKSNVRLVGLQENSKVVQDISAEARLFQANLHQVNLRFDNHRPSVEPIAGVDTATGKRVQNAAVGAVIKLAARGRDKDGDTLDYVWFVGEGHGKLAQKTGTTNEWKLPNVPGRYDVSVVVTDNKGGYDKSTFSVLATGKGTPFTGQVVDLTGNPIKDAEVEIISDGNPNPIVKTNAQGYIATNVQGADRYVLNVRKEGYALNSRIYDKAVTGARWLLRPAQVVIVDPTKDIVLTHKRSQRECTGPISRQASLGIAGESLLVPQWQDGKGNVIDTPEAQLITQEIKSRFNPSSLKKVSVTETVSVQRTASTRGQLSIKQLELQRTATLKRIVDGQRRTQPDKQEVVLPHKLRLPDCGPGVSVSIPANTIVDANDNLVTTPIKLTISTIDVLSPQQMPGDESVISASGQGGYIESFGAGALDLPAGMKLRSGGSAKVVIPVDRSRKIGGAPLPATVPLLSYDEKRGLWTEEGSLSLQTVNGVQSYVGQAKHFSPFNADNVKVTGASCIRVFSPGLPGNYNLEVSAPYQGTGAPKVVSHPISQAGGTEHVVYNLPNNVNVTMVPTTQGANPQVLGYYIVNSGGPQSPSNAPNVPPGPPYDSCQNFVTFTVGGAPNSPFGGEFLHGLGFINAENLGFDDLTYAAPTGNALRDALITASRNYYNTIDPAGDKDTFAKFKAAHGFDPSPSVPVANEKIASYANSGDLGFGRDMHCLKKTPSNNVVCYVTNYGDGYKSIYNSAVSGGPGTPDIDDANAAATRTTVGTSSDLATVAMEYSDLPGAPGNKVVKFYVYKAGLSNSSGSYARSISANLDGRGERPVPQLCLICHGGAIPTQAGGVPTFGNNAQVNFDSKFLPFDHRFFTSPTSPTITAQEPQFKELNLQIVASAGPNTAITEVINGLYTNNTVANQVRDFTIPGWATGAAPNVTGQANFYKRVVADGCRTCHIAQPFSQLQFNTSQKFLHLAAFGAGNNYMMLGTAQNRVCGDYTMPHAFRTHELFWGKYADVGSLQSPSSFSMATEFQNFGNGIPAPSSNWSNNLCTSFVSSSVVSPSSFYTQSIQPIFNGKCTACHVGGFKPLTTGQSLNTLTSLSLITPGNDSVAANELLVRTTASLPNDRMPPNCFRAPEAANSMVSGQPVNDQPCLNQLDIDKIKAWIRFGAN